MSCFLSFYPSFTANKYHNTTELLSLQMQSLELEVEQIRANTISDTSRVVYYSSMYRFLIFLWSHHPELLTDAFVETVNSEQQQPLRNRILDHLKHPLPLEDPITLTVTVSK